ncbi:Calmodulin [Tritrichomonas musculus]|uniref:Calmodulin n=1 Tax=Tritrichomonas musculus TaxID=1915356 RepID=A0ABR2LAF7_9EUKA
MDEVLNYTPELIQEIHKHFDSVDKDHDGKIPVKDIQLVMKSLEEQISDSDLKKMLKELEISSSGSIKFDEFIYILTRQMRENDAEEELQEAFKVFDRDGDGKIPKDELSLIMKNIGEPLSQEELDAFIKEADTNKDGYIDYAQFVHLLLS